jgi:hypothetical protein
MNDLLDLMIADESPSEISDTIKDILFTKAATKIDEYRPEVAQALFTSNE